MGEEPSRRNHPYNGTDDTKPNAIWVHSRPSGGTISSDFPGEHSANSIRRTGDSSGTNLHMNCDVDPHNGGSKDGRWREEAYDPPKMVEHSGAFSQSELTIHPTGCTQYIHSHPCVGAMPAYGSQAMVHGPCLGGHNARVVLPLEMTEEPVYVNAKQYHGILRRRQSRAKAELENKVTRVRKPYLHESRHLHAMRRARGCGGRFLNTTKRESKASENNARDKKNKTASCTRSSTVHGSIGNGQYGQDQTLQLMVNSFLENGDNNGGKTQPGSFFHGRAASGALKIK